MGNRLTSALAAVLITCVFGIATADELSFGSRNGAGNAAGVCGVCGVCGVAAIGFAKSVAPRRVGLSQNDCGRFGFMEPDAPTATPQAGIDANRVSFEGDLGAILATFTDVRPGYEVPISFGRTPLSLQNGVWLDDAFLGLAVTIPARRLSSRGLSLRDLTIFGGLEEVSTKAFKTSDGGRADDEAAVFGVSGGLGFMGGTLDFGAAYLMDRDVADADSSYFNLTAGFTRKYFDAVSNATRLIVNLGQEPGPGMARTASGFLLISENAFAPFQTSTTPYANFWLGKDNPHAVARSGGAGGVLRSVGLAFQSSGVAGAPKLDATGRDTFGGAMGVRRDLGLGQTVALEAAAVMPWDGRNGAATTTQYALNARYQLPLGEQVSFRADASYGVRDQREASFGARMLLRVKF